MSVYPDLRFRSLFGLLLAATIFTPAQAGTWTAAELQTILSETRGDPIPELATADPAQLRETPVGQEILKWALDGDYAIPLTTYTDYQEFNRTGARDAYQNTYFGKREQLARAVMAAWLTNDPQYLNPVCDLIWNICEETVWIAPAHVQVHKVVDLFGSETAASLAHADRLLGDRLPDDIRARIRTEVHRRIIAPYLASPYGWGWGDGSHNWTGVCAGSIGEAALLLEDDPGTLALVLENVTTQLGLYLNRAFTRDGASLEGLGYWNYGLEHAVILDAMLSARTEGRVQVIDDARLTQIARFPMVMALDAETVANFADSSPSNKLSPFLAARVAERTGETGLLAMIGGTEDRNIDLVLRNLLWWNGTRTTDLNLRNELLADAGVAKRIGQAGGLPLVLAAKAGHNSEPHNHNDVGSFILHIGTTTYLCDPGSGLYSKAYFIGGKRYENIFAGAAGHSIPVIGGTAQQAGGQYRGTLSLDEDGTVVVDFTKAYAVQSLGQAQRRLHVGDDGVVTLEDRFTFEGAGLPVTEQLMTWLNVETDGAVARIRSDEGTLEITAEGATLAVEPLTEDSRANHKKDVLQRLTAQYPAAPQITARFVMRFIPKP